VLIWCSMGDSITEGTIREWQKKVGEAVKVDEVVVVIETDKVRTADHRLAPPGASTQAWWVRGEQVSVDIRAKEAGVLVEQFAAVDETVSPFPSTTIIAALCSYSVCLLRCPTWPHR
jgi:hypothetical protein